MTKEQTQLLRDVVAKLDRQHADHTDLMVKLDSLRNAVLKTLTAIMRKLV